MDQTRRRHPHLGQRFEAGRICAQSLVGMSRAAAESRATALGFEPTVIGVTVEWVAADLQPNRIRLRVDQRDIVVDAWAG